MARCPRSPSQEAAGLDFKPWPLHSKPLPLATAQHTEVPIGCPRELLTAAASRRAQVPADWGQPCSKTHRSREAAGRVRPDPQVEDCSSGLPDFVPSPLPLPRPPPFLAWRGGDQWVGWYPGAGSRAVKRVSTQTDGLSVGCRHILRFFVCRRGGGGGGVVSGGWDISAACSLFHFLSRVSVSPSMQCVCPAPTCRYLCKAELISALDLKFWRPWGSPGGGSSRG